jgi:hypothetical protein
MLKILKLITLICAAMSLLSPGVTSAVESLVVRTTFTTLSWTGSITGLYYLDGSEEVSLTVPNGAPSGSYECIADQPLTFYRKGEIGEDGEPQKIPIVSTVIRSTAPDPLLLFFKGEGELNDSNYRVVPIHVGFKNSTKDLYRVFNLSKSSLVAKFQDKQVSLASGKSMTIDSPYTDGPNFGVMIALQAGGGAEAEWKLVYKTFWPYRSGRSGIVFITDRDGNAGKIDVRRYYIPTYVPEVVE